MNYLTGDIYHFSSKSKAALGLVSIFALAGFTWPFFAPTQSAAHFAQYFFWIALPLTFFLLIAQLSDQSLDAKSVALLGMLAALIAALRPLGAGAVGLEPMWFLLILAARVFGGAFGFLLGVLAMLTSALLTGGIGPWLSYQLFAETLTSSPCIRLLMFGLVLFMLLVWQKMPKDGSMIQFCNALLSNSFRYFITWFSKCV